MLSKDEVKILFFLIILLVNLFLEHLFPGFLKNIVQIITIMFFTILVVIFCTIFQKKYRDFANTNQRYRPRNNNRARMNFYRNGHLMRMNSNGPCRGCRVVRSQRQPNIIPTQNISPISEDIFESSDEEVRVAEQNPPRAPRFQINVPRNTNDSLSTKSKCIGASGSNLSPEAASFIPRKTESEKPKRLEKSDIESLNPKVCNVCFIWVENANNNPLTVCRGCAPNQEERLESFSRLTRKDNTEVYFCCCSNCDAGKISQCIKFKCGKCTKSKFV